MRYYDFVLSTNTETLKEGATFFHEKKTLSTYNLIYQRAN